MKKIKISKERQKNLKERAIVCIVVGILVLLFFLLKLVSAGWPLGKEATCNMLNATTIEECDKIWCDIIDCGYNESISACICYEVNDTIINQTMSYFNESNFYNKTYIDDTFIGCRGYTDNQTITLRDNMLDRIDEIEGNINIQPSSTTSTEDAWPWFAWIILAGIVFIGIGYLCATQYKKQKYAKPSALHRTFSKLSKNKNVDKEVPTPEVNPNEFQGEEIDEEVGE